MAWLLAAQCPHGGGCGRAAADMLWCWWGGVEGLKEGSGSGGGSNNRCATALSGWWRKRKVCWGAFPLLGLCCGRATDRVADMLACAACSWLKGIKGGGSGARFARPLGPGCLLVGLRCAVAAQGEGERGLAGGYGCVHRQGFFIHFSSFIPLILYCPPHYVSALSTGKIFAFSFLFFVPR